MTQLNISFCTNIIQGVMLNFASVAHSIVPEGLNDGNTLKAFVFQCSRFILKFTVLSYPTVGDLLGLFKRSWVFCCNSYAVWNQRERNSIRIVMWAVQCVTSLSKTIFEHLNLFEKNIFPKACIGPFQWYENNTVKY